MLAPRPTPKLEDHPSSAVRGCLFNLFTATLHIGGRSSIRNPRTHHSVVTGTHIHGLQVISNEILKGHPVLRHAVVSAACFMYMNIDVSLDLDQAIL